MLHIWAKPLHSILAPVYHQDDSKNKKHQNKSSLQNYVIEQITASFLLKID